MSLSVLTPEEQVLSALERISSLKIPSCAVHVAMSELSPDNRGYRQLEIVSRLFEPLLSHTQSRLFLLSNNDFLLLIAYPVLSMINDTLERIFSLFADDIYFSKSKSKEFSRIFFLDKQERALREMLHVEKADVPVKEIPLKNKIPMVMTKELTPDILEKLLYDIEQTNPFDFMRRQSVIRFDKNATNEEVFQEFYTNITDIQNTFAPDLNLSSNKPLFNLLKETLDARMMKGLFDLKLISYPKLISLNMNTDTVLSPLFEKFIKTIKSKLLIEFQLSDIFHHFELFEKVCRKLRENDIQYAIDDVGINEFELLNLESFDVPYIKIRWSDKWKGKEQKEQLSNFISKHSTIQFVLTHCSSGNAVLFGCKVGIRLFQGSFIDELCARMTKEKCTFGQECSLSECMVRRAVLSGALRNRCVHQPHLDIYMPLKEG